MQVEGITPDVAGRVIRDEFADYTSEALEALWRAEFEFDDMAEQVATAIGPKNDDAPATETEAEQPEPEPLQVDTTEDGDAAADCDEQPETDDAENGGGDGPEELMTVYVGAKASALTSAAKLVMGRLLYTTNAAVVVLTIIIIINNSNNNNNNVIIDMLVMNRPCLCFRLQAFTIPKSCFKGPKRHSRGLARACNGEEPVDSDMWRWGPNGEIVMMSNERVTETVFRYIQHGECCKE